MAFELLTFFSPSQFQHRNSPRSARRCPGCAWPTLWAPPSIWRRCQSGEKGRGLREREKADVFFLLLCPSLRPQPRPRETKKINKNSFVPSSDPRLSRLRKHASSPSCWFRNPLSTLVVIGGSDAEDWKRGGSGVSGGGGGGSGGGQAGLPAASSSPSSSSGRAAARAVAERTPDPLSGPGDWCVLYVPPNRENAKKERASRGSNGEGGASAAAATEGGGGEGASSSNTPTTAAASAAGASAAAASADSVAASKAALRMFSTLRSEFSTRRHERCVRLSDDGVENPPVAVSSTSSSALSSVSSPTTPAWAAQLSGLLASAASQALAARSEAYSKAGRALAAARSAERAAIAAAAASEGTTVTTTTAAASSSSSFAPLFLAKDSRGAMLSASGMTDDAVAEYAELEALHSSFFDEGEGGDKEEEEEEEEEEGDSSTFAADATAAFAAPWSETRRAAFRACSSCSSKNGSSSFAEGLAVRQGVFARRAALLSSSGRHAELATAGSRFIAAASAVLGDERRKRKVKGSSLSALSLLPEAWTASACIALAEAAVRRPRGGMPELVEVRRAALEKKSWGLALGSDDAGDGDSSFSSSPPPLSPADPLDRALAARAGDLYLAARDELGRLLLLATAGSEAPSSALPFPSSFSSYFSLKEKKCSQQQQSPPPLASAAAAASLAGGGSVAGLSPSPTRARATGTFGGGGSGGGESGSSGGGSNKPVISLSRTATVASSAGGSGSDGHLLAPADASGGGAGGVLMTVASLSRVSPLPRALQAAVGAGEEAGAAAAEENGKPASVAGSDGGASAASSSSQQQQPSAATPAAAAPAAAAGTIRPFLARAAELRFRSSASAAAAAAALSADPSAAAAAGIALSVADWASDPSAIEAEIESEGDGDGGRGGEDNGDDETATMTTPRASSSSSSFAPTPPWLSDPRLRLALSSPEQEGTSLWLALSKAAAAAYVISGRRRRAAAAAASAAAAAAATGDFKQARGALRAEAALVSGERWERLSASVLPALLEVRGGGEEEGEDGESEVAAVDPETALAALSLREGLVPLSARRRAQQALAEAVESGREGAPLVLDGGAALSVLPVPGRFSRMICSSRRGASSPSPSASPPLSPATAAGGGAALCSVGDCAVALEVDVSSRLPDPLERVRPVLRLSLLQEVVVDSSSASSPSPRAAGGPPFFPTGGGRFSSEWRETDVVECSLSTSSSSSSSSLITLSPGTTTRLRFALCPLASGAYALRDLRMELLPLSSAASPALSVLAARQPLPELRAAAAVPRPEVLLFASPPRPGARLRVPPSLLLAGGGGGETEAAATAATTKLVAGLPQWLATAAFFESPPCESSPAPSSAHQNLLSSASLFVSPRAPRLAAPSGGEGGGSKGGGERRGASLAGGRLQSPLLSRSASSVSAASSTTTRRGSSSAVAAPASWSLRPGAAAAAVRLSGGGGTGSAVECSAEADAERGGAWLRVAPKSSSSPSLPLPGAEEGEGTLVWLWVEPAGEGEGGEGGEESRAAAAAAPLLRAEAPPAAAATKQQQRQRQQQQHHYHSRPRPPPSSLLSLPLTLPRCGAFEADVQLEYRRGSNGGGNGGGEEEGGSGVRALAARLSVPAFPPLSLSSRLVLLLPRNRDRTTPASAVFELRVRSCLPWPVVLREATLLPQAGIALPGDRDNASFSAPLPLTLQPGGVAALACVLSDDDERKNSGSGGGLLADGALFKPSRVSLRWEAADPATASLPSPPLSSSLFLPAPPPPPPSNHYSGLFSGTVAADFLVEAPLADALPLTEEEEGEEGGEGGESGDGLGDGRATSASASAAAAAPLIAVRFLGPFSAAAGVPTTLCWRLERLPGEAASSASSASASASSFRFEVRAPRGGGWELPGSSSGEAGGEGEESSEDDGEGGEEGGANAAAAAVGGTVRLRAAPGSSAVVEASWTPSSASSSDSSSAALRAPALVVFNADGMEVGRSGSGTSAARSASAGGAASGEEFVLCR